MQNPETGDVVLSLRGLSIDFVTARGTANAVEGVDIDVRRGEKIGIVGESGSGKSIVCKAVLKLLPETAKVSGQALYGGQNLLTRSDREMYGVRGKEIAMVFQEPMTSLNPLFTIGDQLVETITLHQNLSRAAAWERALEAATPGSPEATTAKRLLDGIRQHPEGTAAQPTPKTPGQPN